MSEGKIQNCSMNCKFIEFITHGFKSQSVLSLYIRLMSNYAKCGLSPHSSTTVKGGWSRWRQPRGLSVHLPTSTSIRPVDKSIVVVSTIKLATERQVNTGNYMPSK